MYYERIHKCAWYLLVGTSAPTVEEGYTSQIKRQRQQLNGQFKTKESETHVVFIMDAEWMFAMSLRAW